MVYWYFIYIVIEFLFLQQNEKNIFNIFFLNSICYAENQVVDLEFSSNDWCAEYTGDLSIETIFRFKINGESILTIDSILGDRLYIPKETYTKYDVWELQGDEPWGNRYSILSQKLSPVVEEVLLKIKSDSSLSYLLFCKGWW